ncbi:hypothetical protein EVAR_101906_1 [Eumeta japonica]|uniref:Uncharacterized protein n=1 Tax=Eumeta variegata TaxID=151549 RepID=A0A4C1TSF6_EUMVA|nr:hypothetical protein EVAR_101906_1 [Eumeta japonica]
MAKCQAVWNLCARSPKACEIYLEITGKSPTSPCPTRWNSYYDCITDILKVQETINEVLRKLGLAVLKEIEVQFLIEYINTSKPISEAIRSLKGDKETFYGCLQPELYRMHKMLDLLKQENPVYCDSILAAVSYPFFKLKWVPRAEKGYVKELFIAELRRFKQEDFKSAHPQTSTLKKKQKSESYYMFNDSDSSTTSTDGNSSTCTDLETL